MHLCASVPAHSAHPELRWHTACGMRPYTTLSLPCPLSLPWHALPEAHTSHVPSQVLFPGATCVAARMQVKACLPGRAAHCHNNCCSRVGWCTGWLFRLCPAGTCIRSSSCLTIPQPFCTLISPRCWGSGVQKGAPLLCCVCGAEAPQLRRYIARTFAHRWAWVLHASAFELPNSGRACRPTRPGQVPELGAAATWRLGRGWLRPIAGYRLMPAPRARWFV